MKILAFTDTHLGGGSGYSADRLADQEGTLNQIIEKAAEHGVDGVLFAGDMFDTPRPTVAAQHVLRRFVVGLEQIGVPALAINGNAGHDLDGFGRPSALELAATPWFRVSRVPEMIRWAGDIAVCTLPSVPVTKLGLDHVGAAREEINTLAAHLLGETARELRAQVPEGWPSILMGHWSMTGGALPNGLPVADLGDVVLDHYLLDDLGFDVVFFGHIHKPQRMNEAGTLLYGGPPHVTRFDEAHDEHGCWLLTFEDGNTSVEFVGLTDRKFVTIDVDVTDVPEASAIFTESFDETDRIAAAIATHFPLDDAVVKLRYRATEEQHRRVDLPALKKLIADAGAHRLYQVEPDLIRDSRVRIDGFDQSLGADESLHLWCEANNVSASSADGLQDILTRSREISTRAGVMAGASFDPISLDATNVGRFETLHADFVDGAMVFLGPNGSGKSTALRCLDLALYAEDAGDLRPHLAPWADEMQILLLFTLDGVEHRIRRSFRSRGKGNAIFDFERNDGVDWTTLTRETTKETQRLIAASLGMSHEVFRTAFFIAQGDAPAFLRAKPADRKALFGEALDPAGLWAADAAFARKEAKAVADELASSAMRIEERLTAIKQIPNVEQALIGFHEGVTLAEQTVAVGEIEIEAAQAELAANAAAAERVRNAETERNHAATVHAATAEAVAKCERAAAVLPAERRGLEIIDEVAGNVTLLEQKLDNQRNARAAMLEASGRRSELVRQADEFEAEKRRHDADIRTLVERNARHGAKIDELQDADEHAAICDRCEQTLGAEARAKTIESLVSERATIQTEIDDKTQIVRDLDGRIAGARNRAAAVEIPTAIEGDFEHQLADARRAAALRPAKAQEVATLEEQAGQIGEARSALTAAQVILEEKAAALALASENVRDNRQLARAVEERKAAVATARRVLDEARADVVRLETELTRLNAAKTEIEDLRRATAAKQSELDLLKLAEKAFGRDGIPVLLVETVIGQLDSDANAILRRFPTSDGWTFMVRFETQREQASVDHLKEELYVNVFAPDYCQDFSTLSGGETTRVSFAVSVAFGMLLGRLRGANSRLLVLDELPFLDESGDENLVQLIKELVADQTFRTVATVSHSPNVRDAFENVIQIVKTDGVSRIVGAPVLEEAIA